VRKMASVLDLRACKRTGCDMGAAGCAHVWPFACLLSARYAAAPAPHRRQQGQFVCLVFPEAASVLLSRCLTLPAVADGPDVRSS
jgi:hypothetical protein